jgi:NADH:ubiquinone oxidoreductase subunit F (NADH-binding)
MPHKVFAPTILHHLAMRWRSEYATPYVKAVQLIRAVVVMVSAIENCYLCGLLGVEVYYKVHI